MMQLTREDGTTYRITSFEQDGPRVTCAVVVDGAIYPNTLSWDNCTITIGDKVFTGVRAIIRRVSIYAHDVKGSTPDTTFDMALMFPRED